MVNCPVCEGSLDIDKEDVNEGDAISCDECGADLTVVSTEPNIELESAAELEEEEEDEDLTDDDEEEEDEPDEE